jgi:glutamate-1-semialdehyde 2,1-aminomutase
MNEKRYSRSEAMLERALRSIPLGAQTFSKSYTQYPKGVSPYFITRGKGSHVWDIDGNEYIDFVNSLCSITLGHGDPDVNAAVEQQLKDGTIFTLSHPIETETAEMLCSMVPGAEMVRFGKNGSDATSGAIRVARAHTGRDRVAVCGYHGWQDWYIGSTARNRGVPKAVRDLTHNFQYNNLDSLRSLLEKHKDEFAAVILEPMNVSFPEKGFLEGVKELANKNGALFVLDETITGFRLANGGAQEYFGIEADLATFGKGLSNGYPVSAIAGKAKYMHVMEEIFFSFTFGGETLSLAAALATMKKLKEKPVVQHMKKQGDLVVSGVEDLIRKHGISEVLSISGHPSWTFLSFKDKAPITSWQLKTLYMQELLARGVLSFGTHNMSYAHGDLEVKKLLTAYDEIFPLLKAATFEGKLESLLRCKPLEPLFKVR